MLPEDCRTLAGEIFAWLLVSELRIQKALLLYGAGENGKSTFLAVLTAFLGAGNVSGLSLQRTAVGRCGMAAKISSADWQAGFLGIAGSAGISFIGGNDSIAKDHLSRTTGSQLRRFN